MSRHGFSLIELLVSIAIVATLAALTIPVIQRVRESSNAIKCANNLKQIGIACHAYHDRCGHFPAGSSGQDLYGYYSSRGMATEATQAITIGGGTGFSWAVHLMPDLEQGAMHARLSPYSIANPYAGRSWFGANSFTLTHYAPSVMVCPSNPMPTLTSVNGTLDTMQSQYVAIAGNVDDLRRQTISGYGIVAWNGVMYMNSGTRLTDITDGTSNVMMIGEQTDWTTDKDGRRNTCRSSGPNGSQWSGDWWTGQAISHGYAHSFNVTTVSEPMGSRLCKTGGYEYAGEYGSAWTNSPLRSPHKNGGSNVVMADGSVRYLAKGMDDTVLRLMASRDSGSAK
jgi:prepilin-type N-terminal cleavage/methylation domain-containing protein/prepilin-type processing-associated H-X9-DG protein